jgi:predicted Zn-ribbon and HTH transcriptional regulator
MTIYPVYCPECGWFGMSDDVRYGRCPYCEGRIKRDEEEESDGRDSKGI